MGDWFSCISYLKVEQIDGTKIRVKNHLRKVDLKLINLIKIKVSSKIIKIRKNQLTTDKHKDF